MITDFLTTTTVERIQTLAAELETLGKTALGKAVEAGNLLRECKKELAHGEWLPWIEMHFAFTDRTARRWMKLAEDVEAGRLKSDTVSNLAEAYKATSHARIQCHRASPLELPSPGQRLFLWLANPDHYAVIEPIDGFYVHVTWLEVNLDESFSFAGTKRGIHRDHAWTFLARCSPCGDRWRSANTSLVSWEPPAEWSGTTRNQNLYGDDLSWLAEAFAEEIGQANRKEGRP